MQTKRILASVSIVGAAALGAILSPANAIAHSAKAKSCVAPRVTGDSLPVARRRLDHAGCRVGRVYRPKVASGVLVVRRQSVRPGRRLRHGARVALWLRVKPAKTVGTTAPTRTTTTPAATTTTTPATPTPPAPVVPVVHATIDPTFTQDPADPLHVTWTYDAGASAGSTLPVGVLALSVTPATGGLGPVGGCQMNVGGAVSGETCTVELPQFGSYSVTVTYTGSGGSVGPATQTEIDTISPFTSSTTLACGASGSDAACVASSADQFGNPVSLGTGNVSWTVTDASTGLVVARWSAAWGLGPDVTFSMIRSCTQESQFGVCLAYGAYAIAANVNGEQVDSSDQFANAADSFTAQAVYAPIPGAPESGSGSVAVPLPLVAP